jgi:hypothetical protein
MTTTARIAPIRIIAVDINPLRGNRASTSGFTKIGGDNTIVCGSKDAACDIFILTPSNFLSMLENTRTLNA